MALDVDKMRPGTVPLAPETVLWFEFLLDPSLLERHLNNPTDLSPFELIKLFLGVEQKSDCIMPETDRIEKEFIGNTKRAVAIKALTNKVMAFLKWNLNEMVPKLPSRALMQLLIDLISIATQQEVLTEDHIMMDFSSMSHQAVFSIMLYHRWVLKALVFNSLSWMHPRVLFIPTQGGQDPNAIAAKKREEMEVLLEGQAAESIEVLMKILSSVDSITVPTMLSFVQPTEQSEVYDPKWETGILVSGHEFKCQVHFELGEFFMFRRDHESAKKQFSHCLVLYKDLQSMPTLKSSAEFCQADKEVLIALATACELPVENINASKTLPERFKSSVWNHYTGIIQILQMDNLLREIPIADRDLVEVELQAAVSSGAFTVAKDLLMKMQVLNTLRRVMAAQNPATDILEVVRNGGDRAVDFFLTSIHSVIFDVLPAEQQSLDRFLMDLILRDISSKHAAGWSVSSIILADEAVRSRFSQEDLQKMEDRMTGDDDDHNIIDCFLNSLQDVSLPLIARSPRLEVINIQQQLNQSYDAANIKQLLLKLISRNPTKSWFRINSQWDLPIPLQSVIMSLPKGLPQDLIYILLAKSRQLSNNKDFSRAILLLETIGKEAKDAHGMSSGSLYKLNRLVGWEILLVQINQYLEEFPDTTINPGLLTSACKECLVATSAGDTVIPRLEVLESCALALLNLGEWDVITAMDKRWVYLELASALASACQDIAKHKGTKKISREAWDLVLPVFGPTPQKRNSSGATVSPTGSVLTKSSLVRFLTQLRESTVLTVATSLLARLHNVLRDEPNLEINCQYALLWPAAVSNSNSYNARFVAEVLAQVTTQALKFMPNHFPLLKILGDVNYILNDWGSALRCYLGTGAMSSDYFSKAVPKAALEDFTYKRMIKCCTQLHCYTQAAVLCQCLDDVDYLTAFKCFSETKNLHCADAMDAYYPCIWDITLLEFLVNIHHKRGETQRKQQVVKILGLLELNSNNNEEIQREAANVRRSSLLRALSRQYSIASDLRNFSINSEARAVNFLHY